MGVPVRVTPPVGQVVTTPDLKAALRVDGNESDALIAAYEAAAVAHLDGYRGVLGRCILPQQWAVTYGQAGTYRLPLPDVTAVSAEDADGQPVEAALSHDALGSLVTLAAPATVTLTAALPAEALAAVRQAIRLLVGHWHENRETVVTGTIATELPLSVAALIGPIRRVTL